MLTIASLSTWPSRRTPAARPDNHTHRHARPGLVKRPTEKIGKRRKLAGEFGAILIPLQQRLDVALETVQQDKWSDDMVHPYTWAHAWIAL